MSSESERRTDSGVGFTVNVLSARFQLLKSLNINSHRNFYTLRHNFETWGGESRDQVGVDAIMGHVDPSMAGQYREGISDERLRAVVEAVHIRTFPSPTGNVQ